MFRLFTLSLLGIVAAASMSAAQIQIGALVGNVNNGITASYITGGCASANGPSFAGCIAGSTGTNSIGGAANFFKERDYAGTLFTTNTKTSGPAVPNGVGLGCNLVSSPNGCITDSNAVTFALLNDGSNGTVPNNYWGAVGNSNTGSGTLTIPIGIFGTDQAWTMINNQWGVTGNTNTVVTFYFGTASNTTDAGSLQFNLVNGVQVRDATQCGGSNGGIADCTTFARTTSSGNTTQIYGSNTAGASQVTYNSGSTMPSTYYKSTSGTLGLDDQKFYFGTGFLNDYLTEVTITDQGGSSSGSRTGISAVTVEVAPEPSTILMIVTGLGALGLARFRRKQQ